MNKILDAADPMQTYAIRKEVNEIFTELNSINTSYMHIYAIDSEWFEDLLNKFLFCLQGKRIASREELELDDPIERLEFVQECAEIITNQILEEIKESISLTSKVRSKKCSNSG